MGLSVISPLLLYKDRIITGFQAKTEKKKQPPKQEEAKQNTKNPQPEAERCIHSFTDLC